MNLATPHSLFFAWMHQVSERVKLKKIDVHFEVHIAAMGTLYFSTGEVDIIFVMPSELLPNGTLHLGVNIPELDDQKHTMFSCTVSPSDLQLASMFLYDFSRQTSTPYTEDLPAVATDDLTNVVVFPKQPHGPWYLPYQDAFLPKQSQM